MSLPYELISLDLDLTLLNAGHQISARNLAAVERCRALGAKVVITSGRMYYTTLPYLRAMNLDTPVISYNGAFIKRDSTGEILLNEGLDLATTHEILTFGAGEGLQVNYYLDDKLYSDHASEWSNLYATRTGAVYHYVPDLFQLADRPPTKMLMIDDPVRVNRLYAELQPRYAGRAYITISNAEYLEFMPPHVNKGMALSVVADYYGIRQDKVIAFGDAGNDIPAIEWAGLGVAMENARAETKAAADRIAPRYDEDGVAIVLEEIFDFRPIYV